MNYDVPQWSCGICHHPALFENLVVDEFFDSILSSVNTEVEHVEIELDGSWKVKPPITAEQELINESRKRKRELSLHNSHESLPKLVRVEPESDVIDLTLDTDDDEIIISVE
jgi:hypothetical protein